MIARPGRLQSLLLATILAIGAGVLWTLAMLIAGATVSGLFPGRGEVREQLEILADGTPVLVSRQETAEGREYHGLNGATMEVKRVPFAAGALLTGRPPESHFQALDWHERIQVITDVTEGVVDNSWYFIHDGKLRGHGYFVRYDPETKLLAGYIGRSGFGRELPPLAEQFPVDGARMRQRTVMTPSYSKSANPLWGNPSWTVLLLADDGFYAINLKERTATPLYKAPDLLSFAMTFKDPSVRGWEPRPGPPPARAILLRKPDRVVAIDLSGREFESYPIPAELRNVELSWYRLPKEQVLAVGSPDQETVNELFWIDASGKVARHEQVELRVVQKAEKPWPARIADRLARTGVGAPSPAVIFGIVAWKQSYFDLGETRSRSIGYWTAVLHDLVDFWPVAPFCLLLSVLCYRRQRKFGLPGTRMWTVFVLLFGLPAYFGYLAHREWPARLPCPSCGQRVPRDRPACFACGQDFPAPARKGIEVFA